MFDTGKIGQSFPPFSIDVTRAKIREMALAIGDGNLAYASQQTAHMVGYQDVVPVPTIGTFFLFWGNTHFVEQLTELGLDVALLMHREEEYEYLAPIHVNDTVTGVMTVLGGTTRRGPSNTSVDLVTLRMRYTNQYEQPVLIAITRLVTRQ